MSDDDGLFTCDIIIHIHTNRAKGHYTEGAELIDEAVDIWIKELYLIFSI